ncbi:hypothetical protein N665_0037s0022 [Sinapis alba]|nr:hypothetical protein N665_0037s0022 [Sinapis alba]
MDAMSIDNLTDSVSEPPLDWRFPLIKYLAEGSLPEDKWEAHRLKEKISNYIVIDGKLHHWTENNVLFNCVNSEEADLVMAKTHKGGGGNHSGGRTIALKGTPREYILPQSNCGPLPRCTLSCGGRWISSDLYRI